MSKLLPPNATKLEKNLEKLGEKISSLRVPFTELNHIQQCPVPHLPWLAWAHRVEYWRADWSETEKRRAITNSKSFNAQRGTRSSIEILLNTVVQDYQLIPWYDFAPKQPPFTFVVKIPTKVLTVDELLQIINAVDATKSVRDLFSVSAKVKTDCQLQVMGGSLFGEKITLSTL
ncbi:phage tail protein I [Acinetobacter piscicola]|uniref:phage tail protein I n=1 Tax=Acinetobacter piscicola TaxID=2006115 RepID=UPI0010206B87|nr:phage tail protein I [Acinetobacter piscicola]RYL25917.1 phage tail protein I [Acinetobacter piscicola]